MEQAKLSFTAKREKPRLAMRNSLNGSSGLMCGGREQASAAACASRRGAAGGACLLEGVGLVSVGNQPLRFPSLSAGLPGPPKVSQ